MIFGICDRVKKTENRVPVVLKHTASSRSTSSQFHPVIQQELDPALLPGVLMLANDNALGVPPEEQNWIHKVTLLIEVLLSGKIIDDVVRFSM